MPLVDAQKIIPRQADVAAIAQQLIGMPSSSSSSTAATVPSAPGTSSSAGAAASASSSTTTATTPVSSSGSGVVGVVGLQGMGGVGKTTLCALVARSAAAMNHFVDGIYWLRVGQLLNFSLSLFLLLVGFVLVVVARIELTC